MSTGSMVRENLLKKGISSIYGLVDEMFSLAVWFLYVSTVHCVGDYDPIEEIHHAACEIATKEIQATANATITRSLKGVCTSKELSNRLDKLERKLLQEMEIIKSYLSIVDRSPKMKQLRHIALPKLKNDKFTGTTENLIYKNVSKFNGIVNKMKLNGTANELKLNEIYNVTDFNGTANKIRLNGIYKNVSEFNGTANKIRLNGIYNGTANINVNYMNGTDKINGTKINDGKLIGNDENEINASKESRKQEILKYNGTTNVPKGQRDKEFSYYWKIDDVLKKFEQENVISENFFCAGHLYYINMHPKHRNTKYTAFELRTVGLVKKRHRFLIIHSSDPKLDVSSQVLSSHAPLYRVSLDRVKKYVRDNTLTVKLIIYV